MWGFVGSGGLEDLLAEGAVGCEHVLVQVASGFEDVVLGGLGM